MDTSLLNKLDYIVPNIKKQNPMINQRLVLDDTIENSPDTHRYVTGTNSNLTHESEAIDPAIFTSKYTQGVRILENQGYTNISHLAFWKASSHKADNPIEQALDDNPNTFWQSDGSQPHFIDVRFSKRVEIIQLAIYFSLFIDESYTPEIINLYAGNNLSDATFYKTIEVRNVNGWVIFTFEDNRPWDKLLKCHFLRLEITTNHENGKDTHLRGIRIYSPGQSKLEVSNSAIGDVCGSQFLIHSIIR